MPNAQINSHLKSKSMQYMLHLLIIKFLPMTNVTQPFLMLWPPTLLSPPESGFCPSRRAQELLAPADIMLKKTLLFSLQPACCAVLVCAALLMLPRCGCVLGGWATKICIFYRAGSPQGLRPSLVRAVRLCHSNSLPCYLSSSVVI